MHFGPGKHRIYVLGTFNVSERMLQLVIDCLTPEVAHQIVSSRLDSETQARIDELAAKANRGTLTEEERNEYSQFVEYIALVGIIKAKARLLLSRAGQ